MGKWQYGNETENSTTINESEVKTIENKGEGEGEEEEETDLDTGLESGSESIPAIDSIWGIVVMLGAVFFCKKIE